MANLLGAITFGAKEAAVPKMVVVNKDARLWAFLFEREGFEVDRVEEIETLAEVFSILKKPYDLIAARFTLQNYCGIRFAEYVHRLRLPTKLVLMTASTTVDEVAVSKFFDARIGGSAELGDDVTTVKKLFAQPRRSEWLAPAEIERNIDTLMGASCFGHGTNQKFSGPAGYRYGEHYKGSKKETPTVIYYGNHYETHANAVGVVGENAVANDFSLGWVPVSDERQAYGAALEAELNDLKFRVGYLFKNSSEALIAIERIKKAQRAAKRGELDNVAENLKESDLISNAANEYRYLGQLILIRDIIDGHAPRF
ncbi:hypothetical protein [Variovorax sp. SRS16]|uniref:hypothetical protein n=1 Tax=Variovorax sp. SRS16 TaxID=282217 RepID=UPI0013A57BC6|nr:hypothetical protein [Variovorax sp. SRS16]